MFFIFSVGQFYKFLTPDSFNEAYRLKEKGHGQNRAPISLTNLCYVKIYPTETGAGSSTFASRKNFAASSGGVGLI
jgi:hypothetical protein